MYRQWKQVQVLWEQSVRKLLGCVGMGVRKAKAQLELNLTRGAKMNKKGF